MVMKKGLGDKVMSFFVVREDDEDDATAVDVPISEEPAATPAPPARASAPARAAAGLAGAPLVPPGKAHDAATFRGVYRAAGVGDDAQEKVEKVLTLLASLPASTPVDVRRTIVEASLKAFGVPVDGILDAAEAQLSALDAYVGEGEKRTREVELDAKSRVERLSREIAEIQRLVELQRSAHGELVRATADERDRVAAVFDFFGHPADAVDGQDRKLRLVR